MDGAQWSCSAARPKPRGLGPRQRRVSGSLGRSAAPRVSGGGLATWAAASSVLPRQACGEEAAAEPYGASTWSPPTASTSSTALPRPRHCTTRVVSVKLPAAAVSGAAGAAEARSESAPRRAVVGTWEELLEEESDSPLGEFARELLKECPVPMATPRRWVPPWAAGQAPSPQPEAEQLAEPAALESPRPGSAWREPQLLSQVLDRLLPLSGSKQGLGRLAGAAPGGRGSALGGLRRAGQRLFQLARGGSGGGSRPATGAAGALSPTSVGEGAAAPGRPAAAAAAERGVDGAEVVAFRANLSRTFGNLTRALRAMKNAAGSAGAARAGGPAGGAGAAGGGGAGASLCKAEFEWCVTAFLKHGDRRLAGRLFAALDRDGRGEVGLWELAQPPRLGERLVSMVELRRRILERHRSPWQAFRELEEYLEFRSTGRLGAGGGAAAASAEARRGGGGGGGGAASRAKRALKLAEFVEAIAFFGLEPYQATHLFGIMDADGNGLLTLDEFMEALTQMPREVLLQDLRQRLLARHASLAAAFRELRGASEAVRLGRLDFYSALARLGVVEGEAAELFRIIDEDESGDVSLEELRDALRDVAPAVSLEGFWQRMEAEWPEMADKLRESRTSREAGAAAVALRRAGTLLAELLPEEELAAASPSAESGQAVFSLSAAGFDALASRLDVARSNAAELFARLVEAAALLRRRAAPADAGLGQPATSEVYLEDLAELYHLWMEQPAFGPVLGSDGAAGAAREDIRQAVAPAQAAIAALKAELASAAARPAGDEQDRSSRASSRRVQSRQKQPVLPWRAH